MLLLVEQAHSYNKDDHEIKMGWVTSTEPLIRVRGEPHSMTDGKRETARRFGEAADAYFESSVHRDGADLETLAEWCVGADTALDLATGAGHTAGALVDAGVPTVVAADVAPEMVAKAVDAYHASGVVADAERLPFADDSFDAVTCRIAAHHFPDPRAFVQAVARVLRPGGVFAFEDNIAPDDPALADWVNDIERRRDPSHVELHTVDRWTDWLTDAGLAVEEIGGTSTRLVFEDWVERTNVPAEDRTELQRRFRDAPEGAHDLFQVEFDAAGHVVSWSNPKTLIRASRT